MDCLFCQITQKSLRSDIVYEDKEVMAFRDIRPKAPVHILIVPFLHIETLNDMTEDNKALIGHMVYTATYLARELNIEDSGYRLVYNVNRGAGQTVFHIHLHLMGGRLMNWPPG